MPFDQTAISDPVASRDDASLIVSWASTAPVGTVFQVYMAGRLAWSGTAKRAVIPYPGTDRAVAIDVGAVAAGEGATDFSATLPAHPGGSTRAKLTWTGGAHLGVDVEAYRVYMGTVAGGAVNYAALVATIPAYTGNVITSTFGDGTFGGGSFGYPDASYSWISPSLAAGTWHFGVTATSAAGNEGAAQEITAAIAAPPGPPAADAAGRRLAATYDDSTFRVTLAWLASQV